MNNDDAIDWNDPNLAVPPINNNYNPNPQDHYLLQPYVPGVERPIRRPSQDWLHDTEYMPRHGHQDNTRYLRHLLSNSHAHAGLVGDNEPPSRLPWIDEYDMNWQNGDVMPVHPLHRRYLRENPTNMANIRNGLQPFREGIARNQGYRDVLAETPIDDLIKHNVLSYLKANSLPMPIQYGVVNSPSPIMSMSKKSKSKKNKNKKTKSNKPKGHNHSYHRK